MGVIQNVAPQLPIILCAVNQRVCNSKLLIN